MKDICKNKKEKNEINRFQTNQK